jgi:uncharacterized protein YebE (UPF0316 family)
MSAAIIGESGGMLTPLLVFLAGAAYVTIDTMRIMFVARGMRHVAAILAAIAITTFLLAAGAVLSEPLEVVNVLAYGAGYGVGTHLGIAVESKLAVGHVLARIITEKDTRHLAEFLRGKEFEITTVSAEIESGQAHLLFSIIKRSSMREFIQIVRHVDMHAFVSFQDVRSVDGGDCLVGSSARAGLIQQLLSRLTPKLGRQTSPVVQAHQAAPRQSVGPASQLPAGPG